ncbi:hypothetical protein [Actinomadura macrotermitis]|uniref:Uncharacterized protein n=1 Tax=Actinomadura macrotermitis TaxID=2585200 RepID=A0A7K0BR90_9ACTN|nr:hypothetical protein [Actinomadura macrotermitis]MQY03244.1 hypothetical protein [Actinomadura macrotermitis]
MKGIIIGTGAAAALAVGAGYTAIADEGRDRPAAAAQRQERTVTTLSGYELDADVKSAAAFSGNDLIFDGTVAGPAEQPRRVVRRLPSGGTIDYVYTPVPVRVDRVRKGKGIAPGQVVRVRALGGTSGSHSTFSSLGPRAAEFGNGLRVTLFTQPQLDAGDGQPAITPNFSFGYTADQKTVYNLGGEHRKTTTAQHFQQALRRVR